MDEQEIPKLQTELDNGSIGRPPRIGIGAGTTPPPRSVCCVCRRLVLQAQQIMPFMAAYVCVDCEANGETTPIDEADIKNKVFAPWSAAQVDAINEYQKADTFLPFVCPLEHVLFADQAGLHCRQCPAVHLLWSYSWILERDWINNL